MKQLYVIILDEFYKYKSLKKEVKIEKNVYSMI